MQTCLRQHKEQNQDKEWEAKRGCRVRSLLSVFKLHSPILPSYSYTLIGRLHVVTPSALLPATCPIRNSILSLPLSSRICFILGSLIRLPDLILPALHITPSRTALLVSRENSTKKATNTVLLHSVPNQVVLDIDLWLWSEDQLTIIKILSL